MKKVISLILVVTAVALSLLALSACTEKETAKSIYDIANNSPATEITTSVQYTTKGGEILKGWYVTRVDGNDAIFEYKFDRYVTVDEAVESGSEERIVPSEGKIYYIDGKYIDSTGDGGSAPWVGAPSDMIFKFNLSADKLTNPVVSSDGTTLSASMTPENCEAIFGLDFDAKEVIYLTVTTNSVNLQEVRLNCVTKSGASLNIITSYAPTSVDLDFSEIFGEEE